MSTLQIIRSRNASVTFCDTANELNDLRTNASTEHTVELAIVGALSECERLMAALIGIGQEFSVMQNGKCIGGRNHTGYWYAAKPLDSVRIALLASIQGKFADQTVPAHLGGKSVMPAVFIG